MRALFAFLLLYCMFFSVTGDDIVNQFIIDTISAFGFTSPTILYDGDMPEICFTRQWVLCLDYEYEQTILPDKKGTPSVLKFIFCCYAFQECKQKQYFYWKLVTRMTFICHIFSNWKTILCLRNCLEELRRCGRGRTQKHATFPNSFWAIRYSKTDAKDNHLV